MDLPVGLARKFKTARGALLDLIDEGRSVRVVTHNDADGLTSGSIMHLAVAREGGGVHTRGIKQLEAGIITGLAHENPQVLIFTDMGSGQLDSLREHLLDRTQVFVLDHHEPGELDHDNLHHLNCHDHGVDGAKDVSGAGMAYLFAREISRDNTDLAAMAVVGALGDVQDSEGHLRGLNTGIARDAEEAGFLRVEKDLRLYGRQTRPLHKALEYTTEPFIPGLSGSESRCLQFLSDLDIPSKREGKDLKLADLSPEERQRLTTALILKMIEYKVPPEFAEGIVGDVFTLVKEERRTPLRDAKEFATVLNACGKHERYALGMGICMGERARVLDQAKDMLKEHKGYLSKCFNWLTDNLDLITDAGDLYYFHARDEIEDSVIGTVAAMVLNSRTLTTIRPMIAFAYSGEDGVKISGRGTRELIERGLDMGRVMNYAAEKLGGEGGGHDIAAGAKIKKGQEDDFIRYAQVEIGRQMG